MLLKMRSSQFCGGATGGPGPAAEDFDLGLYPVYRPDPDGHVFAEARRDSCSAGAEMKPVGFVGVQNIEMIHLRGPDSGVPDG